MGRLLKPSSTLFAIIARILRPLARLMIARGITLPAAVEMLKEAFVDVAARDFRIGDAPTTDSRVSLLTGVHRKDVKRLREGARRTGAAPPDPLNVLSEVVTRWASDRRYLGRDGRPKPLPRSATGNRLSFDNLAYGISSDLKPRPILDELLRLGLVSANGERLELNVEAFVPPRPGDEKVFFLGENVGDHLAAGVHNVLDGTPAFLDQAIYSDDLSPESVNELLHLSREQWSDVLKVIVRRTAELEARDKAAGRATERINVGMYYYSERRGPPTGGES